LYGLFKHYCMSARSGERFGLNGAGEGIRTLDIHLGKVVLYQLSYARIISFK
jgi:hypothetical protein